MQGKTLLICNINFAPASFGGATIIAENMATILSEYHGWKIFVVTALHVPGLAPFECRRYSYQGYDVFGISLPHPAQFEDDYENDKLRPIIGSLIDRVRPDAAHVHCIQRIGVGILDELIERCVPVALTIHDCWWICERQFMINTQDKYCSQRKIDFEVCKFCIPDIKKTRQRSARLRRSLDRVDRLLFPSAFQRDLYIANGFPPTKCFVNKNGVRRRAAKLSLVEAKPEHRVRFGFVGGPGPIKGADLICKAFRRIARSDYELRVVDAAQHIGLSWRHDPVWKIAGKVTFVAPYNQDTMDDFFDSIDVLLFPSQWKESFGLTVREALVRGIWVIVTDAGGVVEDCIDGVNSTIIPMDGDYITLSDAITAYLERPVAPSVPATRVTTIEEQASELNVYLRELVDERCCDKSITY